MSADYTPLDYENYAKTLAKWVLSDGMNFKSFLVTAVRNHTFTTENQLLIMANKGPNTVDVRRYVEWEQLGASINKDVVWIPQIERETAESSIYFVCDAYDTSYQPQITISPVEVLFEAILRYLDELDIANEVMDEIRGTEHVHYDMASKTIQIKRSASTTAEKYVFEIIREMSHAIMDSETREDEKYNKAAYSVLNIGVSYAICFANGIDMSGLRSLDHLPERYLKFSETGCMELLQKASRMFKLICPYFNKLIKEIMEREG